MYRCVIHAEYRHSKQKTLTPRRHALSEKTSTGGDDMLDDEPNNPPAAAENAAQSSYCHVNNNDRLDSSRDAHHNDVIADSDDGAKLRDQSDRCPIKKSVSFRAEWQPPGGNTDADKRIMSSTYRSLPRPRQRTDQRQQHNQHSAPVPFSKTTDSGRDWLSVKSGLRDLNNKQDSGSRRSQSSGPSRRSTCASGLMTQQDCGKIVFIKNKNSNAKLSDPETRISFLFAKCRPTQPRRAAGAATACMFRRCCCCRRRCCWCCCV